MFVPGILLFVFETGHKGGTLREGRFTVEHGVGICRKSIINRIYSRLSVCYYRFARTPHPDGIDDSPVGRASSEVNLVCGATRTESRCPLPSRKTASNPLLYDIHIYY